jgi:hypothetical protein
LRLCHSDRSEQRERSGEPALRVCDFFKTAKNQRCKQYSYADKMVEKSKKSQTLSAVEEDLLFAGSE